MITVSTSIAAPVNCSADGSVSIVVHIRNSSPVPAQLPFFCMTDLKMNVNAPQGWHMDHISSDGRRMVRFLPSIALSLAEGQTVPACILTADWFANGGFFISFSYGSRHALDQLRNMKLFCISGAANFPSQRSYLVIDADEVRAAVHAAAGVGPQAAQPPLLANAG